MESETANAPMIEASSRAIANSTPASLPAWASRPCAMPAVSEKLPKPSVPAKAAAVRPIMQAPPITTTPMPIARSAFSYFMKRGVMRLSMTYDCWKNSCQGATVVPTIPMISSITVDSSPAPPGMFGTTKSWANCEVFGWARK